MTLINCASPRDLDMSGTTALTMTGPKWWMSLDYVLNRSDRVCGGDDAAADELEAIRQLKARYCRYLDTRDVEGWRGVFRGGSHRAARRGGVHRRRRSADGSRDHRRRQLRADGARHRGRVATVHHCHTPRSPLTSPTTATGIWAMEDLLFFPRRQTVCTAPVTTTRPLRARRPLVDHEPASEPNTAGSPGPAE